MIRNLFSQTFIGAEGGTTRDADKSLARSGRKQATEDFDFHITYL